MADPAGASFGLVHVQAVQIAIAGFVIPYMAVYTPALMLQDAGPMAAAWGYPVEVAYVFFKACFGIALVVLIAYHEVIEQGALITKLAGVSPWLIATSKVAICPFK